MNRKDLFSLMEAYEDVVLDKEFSDEDDRPNPDAGLTVKEVPDDAVSIGHEPEIGENEEIGDIQTHDVSVEDMKDNEEEKQRMVASHLHTIRSHAHEISTCVENGANIDPWMEEKIAIANDYIVHVANAIMYRK
jgi:hypothetical protein